MQVGLLRGWPYYLSKRSPYLVLILVVSGPVGYPYIKRSYPIEVTLQFQDPRGEMEMRRRYLKMVRETEMVREIYILRWWETEIAEGRWR